MKERANGGDGWDTGELERAGRLAASIRPRGGADARIVAVRAPGRVNLIGEHTDYSGLPVLPVAIDRSTIIAAAANSSGEIDLINADPQWPSRRFRVEQAIPPYQAGDWGNYVKAAVQGVIEHFAARRIAIDRFRGAAMAVEGRVPPASGLSSSSALTVAAALAFIAVNGLELDPLVAAATIAKSEQYVGMRGGGMDQAAAIFGQRDHALFIEFDPLRVRPVSIPHNAALVVADSREVADKSGKVRDEYNRRVVECALAARILGGALKLDRVRILGNIIRATPDWSAAKLVETLAAAAPAHLGADLHDAARILKVPHLELESALLGVGTNRIALDSSRPLEIRRRARHVLGETERVIRAAAALEAGRLQEMGELMNQSHRSLADDFQCSTARLDAMVEYAQRAGALGARLTGAGFGGSIVALCEADHADAVIAALDRGYYAKLMPSESPERVRAVLHAGAGAATLELAAA
ncbi:MAG TPA: galactokinase [Candidatus Binataceae bacterium]|nr:galactokinase [Candidatus Binataceae bacterium]